MRIPFPLIFETVQLLSDLKATKDEEVFAVLLHRYLELAGWNQEDFDKALMEYVDQNWNKLPN